MEWSSSGRPNGCWRDTWTGECRVYSERQVKGRQAAGVGLAPVADGGLVSKVRQHQPCSRLHTVWVCRLVPGLNEFCRDTLL